MPNSSIIEIAFIKLVLEETISLEQAKRILESYEKREELLLTLNELIDSRAFYKMLAERSGESGKRQGKLIAVEAIGTVGGQQNKKYL